MSEPYPASQLLQTALRPMRGTRLSSLEALERGFALFRSTFAGEAWRYYLGAAPLVLCFIPIWVINGQIRISDAALLMETALLTLGYLLRVWMVGSYMQHVRRRAFNAPIPKASSASARVAEGGQLLAWKIVLGGAAFFALPTLVGASWFYGACQFASLDSNAGGESHSFSGCLALSSQWFGGSLLLLLMLLPLWGSVWLNCAIVALALPQLLHSVFGLNTLLSTQMGIWSLIQSSAFWLSLLAGAWLALDPIVKCTYVVVYQHLRSRSEGYDLRGLLASLPREQEKKAQLIASKTTAGTLTTGTFVLGTILAGLCLATPARAAQVSTSRSAVQTADASTHEARIEKLRTALSQESQRAIYRWHDAEHPSPPTWLDKMFAKIGNSIERSWNAVLSFLRRVWPSALKFSPGEERASGWHLKDLRVWLAVVACLTVATGGVLVWLRRRRQTPSLSIPLEIVALPALDDSSVAIEHSEDEWFALAIRLEKEGELRLAHRAAYLGLLAGLAQREWLTIRRDRTNREYLNEFTRRWGRRPQAAIAARLEVPDSLRSSLRQFDRVWYGFHAVTPESVATYRQDQREFLNHV